MPADKKPYSLDDIKPMSAMSIEPADQISRSFEAEFSRIFGEPAPREVAGIPRGKTKSDIISERQPDVVRIPKARVDRDDTLGLPSM